MDDILQRVSGVHFFFSLILTLFFLKAFSIAPPTLDVALFACISAPATYAMSYYTRQPKYVLGKKPVHAWWVEFEALLMSFIMGYVMYTALTEAPVAYVYVLAFILTQFARLLLVAEASLLEGLGVDIGHPLVVLAMATSTALIASSLVAVALLL